MAQFGMEDDGEFLDQQPDQGDNFMSDDDDSLDQQSDQDDSFMSDDDSFMSDDDDSFLDEQSDQEYDSFMSDDDDSSLDEQSDQEDDSFMSDDDDYSLNEQSDQEDDSFMSDDDDYSLDEQSDQDDMSMADDDDDFLGRQADQDDLLMAHLMGAIRSYSHGGFRRPGGADGSAGADDPAVTYSDYYYVFNLPRPRAGTFPAAESYAVEDDEEDYPFPVQAPPAAASEAAIAALETAEAPADDCCPVCLQDGGAAPAAWMRVAPCGHRFHAACVEQWLRVNLSCPVCRCPAAAAAAPPPPAACRRDSAAAEHPPLILPDIVEEMMAMSHEESVMFTNGSRWLEFMVWYRRPWPLQHEI